MSDYDELKKELHRVSHLVSVKHREIKQLSDELQTIEKEKEAVKKSYDVSLKSDYNVKYKDHLDKIIGPIDSEIANTKKEISDEDVEFQKDFDELTEEKFMERCTDMQDLLEQVQERSSALRTKLRNLVGPRLYKNVSRNLKTTQIKLGIEDLDRVISYFNQCEEKVTEMLERPDFIGDFIQKIEMNLQSFEGGTIESKGLSIFLAIVLIASIILLYKFVFPFYVVFILFIAFFHVFRTYSVYEILLVQKAIIDNIESIENKLHEQARYEAEQARAELQQEHQARSTMLQEKLQSLMEKQSSAVNASKESFFYDSSSLTAAMDSKIINLDKREADAVSAKMIKNQELESLTSELNEIKQRMDSVFSSQQNEYFNYEEAGSAFILDRQFLIDIDDVTKKLSFFSFPTESTLFIYKDKEEAINFIKLLNVQIRAKLHPSCYEVTYYDPVNIGQDLVFFVPEAKDKNDPSERLFKIVSNDQDFSTAIDGYVSEMKSRQKNFKQDGTIDAYNKHMLEIDSLPMPYYFIFLLDPSDSIFKKLSAITRAAGMYGIYVCTFVNEQALQENANFSKSAIDMHVSFYALANDKINSRAKSFVLDNYCNKKAP